MRFFCQKIINNNNNMLFSVIMGNWQEFYTHQADESFNFIVGKMKFSESDEIFS